MWCKNCNIETNEEKCPICGEETVEDYPTEVYWCEKCKVPVMQAVNQAWSILSMPLERQLFCPVEINCRSAGGSVRSSIRALTLIWEDDILFC